VSGWPLCECGAEAMHLEYADHGEGFKPYLYECDKCKKHRLALGKAMQAEWAKKIKEPGHYSLRDIIAPVRGMGRTAKLQNFWLSVFARHGIRSPADLEHHADRLWKMRNVSERTISAIVMSAGRFGLVVPAHPNCQGRAA
jgi:hypothetical protein